MGSKGHLKDGEEHGKAQKGLFHEGTSCMKTLISEVQRPQGM